jgi:hypothetical protein
MFYFLFKKKVVEPEKRKEKKRKENGVVKYTAS